MPSRRSLLATIGAAGAAGIAGCSSSSGYDRAAMDAGDATDWPTAGHDRHHTRYIPDGTGPRSGVTERWRVPTGLHTAEPVVAGGTVFLVTGADVLALDAQTGEKRWSVAPENRAATYWAAPTVYEGVAYVAGDERVRAFDVDTGRERWAHEFGELTTATPTLSTSGTGLFVAAGETVARLDRETGAVDWQRRLFGQVRRAVAVRTLMVVVATEGGDVYALSADSGDGYWHTALPDYCQSTPTVVGDRTFVGCFDGNLYAIGGRGQVEWTTEIGGFAKGGIGVADGTVYADGGRELHAVDAESGERRWRVDVGTTGDHPPVIVGDTVYTGGDRLRALEPGGGIGTGDLRVGAARFTADVGRYVGPLSAANGSLYAAVVEWTDDDTGQRYLIRFDPA